MIGRLILKVIAVITFISIAIVALAVVGLFGYFLIAALPDKMIVMGRVTDSGGNPIKGVKVHAVPLPIRVSFLEESMEPQDKEHITVTDEHGRYRFKGLIASGGVKEGIWIQEYDIVASADSYSSKKIHVHKDLESKEDVITLMDFILEEKPSR